MAFTKRPLFHEGEIAVHTRLGIADQVAAARIRSVMTQQHQVFFADLPYVILGLLDDRGYPWAIPLFGREGFIRIVSDSRLYFQALPALRDALSVALRVGQKIAVLGIQLNTRRRNRVNGVIAAIDSTGFMLEVEQSFGNCPKYIQKRDLIWADGDSVSERIRNISIAKNIDEKAKEIIERADTFFIASRSNDLYRDAQNGVDVSHRGGIPGFIKIIANKLYFPDFSGNNYFNTIGNIQSDCRIGLFFPNYATGDAIFMVGSAELDWEGSAVDSFDGAERIVEVAVEKVIMAEELMPMLGELIERSPFLAGTGRWGGAE
tara:strand:+ start:1000 stop:1956 length:957 start_codon:yes stop_codon:yes gene_type:complete